jgi:hypothetical protein
VRRRLDRNIVAVTADELDLVAPHPVPASAIASWVKPLKVRDGLGPRAYG